jgi:hypothetical protein
MGHLLTHGKKELLDLGRRRISSLLHGKFGRAIIYNYKTKNILNNLILNK